MDKEIFEISDWDLIDGYELYFKGNDGVAENWGDLFSDDFRGPLTNDKKTKDFIINKANKFMAQYGVVEIVDVDVEKDDDEFIWKIKR